MCALREQKPTLRGVGEGSLRDCKAGDDDVRIDTVEREWCGVGNASTGHYSGGVVVYATART